MNINAQTDPCDHTLYAERKEPFEKKLSYFDGTFYCLMVGCGESYLAAFALAIGRSEVLAGLLATLPLIFGGAMQLVTPKVTGILKGHKTWVVTLVSLQALVFLSLAYFAWKESAPFLSLFVASSLYWGFGMAAGAVWNNWIDSLVPRHELASFFAIRARLTQFAIFISFCCAGFFLHYSPENTQKFIWVFLVACAARLISAFFLSRQPDQKIAENPAHKGFLRKDTVKKLLSSQGGRFLRYMLLMQASLNLAAPFFTPFMLGQLNFSYAQYTVVVGAAYVSKILLLPIIARIVNYFGSFASLWTSGIAISFPPLIWVFTSNIYILIGVQIFVGFVWGTFELASTLLIFDRIPAEERISLLTFYQLLNSIAVAGGSILGGIILSQGNILQGYYTIFTLSTIARILSLLTLYSLKPWGVRSSVLLRKYLGSLGSTKR